MAFINRPVKIQVCEQAGVCATGEAAEVAVAVVVAAVRGKTASTTNTTPISIII